jgi:hypothetical protein
MGPPFLPITPRAEPSNLGALTSVAGTERKLRVGPVRDKSYGPAGGGGARAATNGHPPDIAWAESVGTRGAGAGPGNLNGSRL